MRRDPFQSIADPNRRKIIDILFTQGVMTMNQLAAEFDISRPAVSKHVKILEKSGVVDIKQVRVERFVHLNFDALKTIHEWVLGYQKGWLKQSDPSKPVKKAAPKKPKAAKKPVKKTATKKSSKKDDLTDDEREQLSLF